VLFDDSLKQDADLFDQSGDRKGRSKDRTSTQNQAIAPVKCNILLKKVGQSFLWCTGFWYKVRVALDKYLKK